MKSLTEYALKNKYARVKKLRPDLEKIKDLVDWKSIKKLFNNNIPRKGRPSYDIILMFKILMLQNWYGISDEEIEFQINDRLSFQHFLDFPEDIPDHSTIWRFREFLTEGDRAEVLWINIQKQLNKHLINVEKGVIQDAKIIQAPKGKNGSMKNRGRSAKTSRNKDGSWTKKNNKWQFGYKLHTKVEAKNKIIREMGVSTARTHDGKIDLAKPDEINYRDKGYSGCKTKAIGDATMKRGNLTPKQKHRNKRITKNRCRGEHQYGTMVRSLKAGTTRLTELARVYVQQMFVCINYNFLRLKFLLS